MKVLSNKQTCQSTSISGPTVRRVPVQIHLRKCYSYDWRHLTQVWLENGDKRPAEFWLLEDSCVQ